MKRVKNHPLQNIAARLQQKLEAELSQFRPIKHAGTKGDATESAWISFFREYLPTRFRVSKGIIIDCNGKMSEQIDCVIFDSQFTPQIIPNKLALLIPAEAVHAVFEVKQKVSKRDLKYAVKKIKSVRDLERTTASYKGDGKKHSPKSCFHIIGGLLATSCEYTKGFNANFVSNLNAGVGVDLDFIFSAKDGYVDLINLRAVRHEGRIRNKGTPFIIDGECGVSYGLIRLLEELTWQGTVPAVEWSKYLNNLATPKTIEIKKRKKL